jgi:SWIM zinc finger
MLFNYKYHGNSGVATGAKGTDMSFAPDTLRSPTYFIGTLAKNIGFREAMSALHHVVVSDMRFKPQDKSTYKEWAAQNELKLLGELAIADNTERVKNEIRRISEELNDVRKEKSKVMQPFYDSRSKYFNYLYEKERDTWFVLDPVITVHPDEIFFECFSQDESSYGRLGCSYEVFKNINEFECGTTNIDYSAALYNEFQKIRDYKETVFKVEPGGFHVDTTNEDTFTEVKIDLPDSWVRGFLQVSSAMTIQGHTFDLHPMDVHNILYHLKRKKEIIGPRSLRFRLTPGEPISVLVEPFGIIVTCPRSIYNGKTGGEVRIWGRRRLLILERLLPVTQKFTVHLLGNGLPSFFIADLGYMNFTLGLSGWTSNDWSKAGNFDLMAPRATVDDHTKQLVFNNLKSTWFATADELATRMKLPKKVVEGALSAWTQAGRVMYDLNKNVYRVRELSREPLPMDQLRFDNPREADATQLVAKKAVKVQAELSPDQLLKLTGTVKQGSTYTPELWIDGDERLKNATCSCHFYRQNKLFKGPCEHILAMRMAYNQTSGLNKILTIN